MPNPFVRKLELLGPLFQEERQTLEGFPTDVHQVGADQDLMHAGERSSDRKLVVIGFACCCKPVDDGRLQIVSYRIPGDILDSNGLLLGSVDHGIFTITQAEIVLVAHATLLGWAEH